MREEKEEKEEKIRRIRYIYKGIDKGRCGKMRRRMRYKVT